MSDRAQIEEVESQAALYALGSLGGGEGEQFQKRLDAGCPLCRSLLSGFEGVATALALAAPDVEPPARVRACLLERIGAGASPKPKRRGSLLVRAEQTPWLDTATPGVQMRELRGQSTMLLRMAPDTWLAAHEHEASEQCLVLEGSVESEGVTAFAGDYIYMPKGTHHASLYSKAGCTMLLAYSA